MLRVLGVAYTVISCLGMHRHPLQDRSSSCRHLPFMIGYAWTAPYPGAMLDGLLSPYPL